MQDVRNDDGKLVCRVDPVSQIIEIVLHGAKTVIRFTSNGKLEITNSTT